MVSIVSIEAHQSASLYALPDLLVRGKFSKSHLYNLMRQGRFPAPLVRMGSRFTRWSAASVNEWFADPQVWIMRNSANDKVKS